MKQAILFPLIFFIFGTNSALPAGSHYRVETKEAKQKRESRERVERRLRSLIPPERTHEELEQLIVEVDKEEGVSLRELKKIARNNGMFGLVRHAILPSLSDFSYQGPQLCCAKRCGMSAEKCRDEAIRLKQGKSILNHGVDCGLPWEIEHGILLGYHPVDFRSTLLKVIESHIRSFDSVELLTKQHGYKADPVYDEAAEKAAKIGNFKVVCFLMENCKVDVNTGIPTLLYWAVAYKDFKNIRYLLEAGADPRRGNPGKSALDRAWHSTAIMQELQRKAWA